MILITFQPRSTITIASFINTDTWESTAFIGPDNTQVTGYTQIFGSSNQIVLLMRDGTNYWTMQTAYDKLNYTEVYNATTIDNITDVTSTVNFTATTIVSQVIDQESTTDSGASAGDETFNNNTDLPYKVTAFIFSTSVQEISGTTNDTNLGVLEFDCYQVTSSGSSVNFTNQLTLTQSDGQPAPSWMTLDPVTGNLSISNDAVAVSGIYNLSNIYTGALGTFALQSNVSITITEAATPNTNTTTTNENNEKDSDAYCLDASSKGLCGLYVFLIIAGVIGLVIITLVLAYIKCKRARNSRHNVSKVEQQDAEEVEERNNNSRDESVPLDQQNKGIRGTENQEAVPMKDVQENQV